MREIKISRLPKITTTTGAETFLVIQGGTSKKVILSDLFDGMTSNKDITFNVDINDFNIKNGNIDLLTIKGDVTNRVGIFNSNPLSKLHVGGDLRIGNSAVIADISTTRSPTPAIFITPYELVKDADSISIGTDTTLFSVNSARTYSVTDGVAGQEKTFVLYDVSGAGSVTLTPINKLGFISVKLNSLGACATMKFISGKWVVKSINNTASII